MKAFIVLLFIFNSIPVQGDNETKKISHIVIIGNKATAENVILRELLFKVGNIPDEKILELSRKRLMNLYLFNRVEIYQIQQKEGILILIEVTEQIYLYPYPIFDIHDRDWGKISYGLSLNHSNFRGQNEKLTVAGWFGYQPGFGLAYSDPWAGDSIHLTTGFSANKYTTKHRILDFKEKHISSGFNVGKYWNLYFKTQIGIYFDQITVSDRYSLLLHSGKPKENLWGVELYIRHDTRDLYSYPTKGWNNSLLIHKNGIFQTYNNYLKLIIDIRRYFHWKFLIFASRFFQQYLFGQVPVYRQSYIGFSERIRGHFYDTAKQGRHIHIISLELRFPIIPVKYYSYKFPFIPSEYLKNLKLGLSGGIFLDNGIIWKKSTDYDTNYNQVYSINNYITGFGIGLHIHMPYIEIFRLDYGMDLNFNHEFIAEMGLSF